MKRKQAANAVEKQQKKPPAQKRDKGVKIVARAEEQAGLPTPQAGAVPSAGGSVLPADGRAVSAGQSTAGGEQNAEKRTVIETAALWLFPILLFFAMTVQSGWMSVLLAGLAIALSIGKTPLRNLRQSLSLPVIGLVCYAVLNGFAAIYSPFGEYAAREFGKILASFALAVVILTRFKKGQTRGLLWGFSGVSAAISLLCVDMAGEGAFYRGFMSLMASLGSDYAGLTAGAVTGTQIDGIFNDANLSGSLLALGILAALYLALSGKKFWERPAACLLLGVNSMGFFLSMSRGAILSFAVAALVYLALAGKGHRLPLFFLLFSTAVTTVALSVVCMGYVGKNALPVALTLLCGAVIFALDWAVGSRLAAKLEGHGKGIAIAVAAVAILCGGYAVAGLTVTGPYTFTDNGTMLRTETLPAGDYTLSGDWDEGTTLYIQSRTRAETLRTQGTQLYSGVAGEGSFTVPADVDAVDFIFYGSAGSQIRTATLSNGQEIGLNHPLLPDFLVNRMQGGILSSSAFLLRWQFMKDGLTLFAQSPLLGYGLGSSEGLLTSVQPFFYETLYIHNHLIQAMDDMGLLGLAALLTIMLGAVFLLLRRLRRANDPLAAMLLACLVMMNLHGLMEITFSVRMYQCAAWTLVAVIAIVYGQRKDGERSAKGLAKYAPWVMLAVLWLYLATFGGLYASHLNVQRETASFATTDAAEFMDGCAGFVKGDVFDHEQAQLTYVGNAVMLDSIAYNGNMLAYVRELRASGTYTACSGLANYYYLPKGDLKNLFAASREGIAQEASSADAWNLQLAFYRDTVLPEMTSERMPDFVNGVLATRDYLEEYSRERLEEISISEENQAFLQAAEEVRAASMPGDAAQAYLLRLAAGETPAG